MLPSLFNSLSSLFMTPTLSCILTQLWYDKFVKLQLGCHPVAVVQFTFTHKQYIEQHNNFGRVGAVPPLCELYPGICHTTEEKIRKNLSQTIKTTINAYLTHKNIVLCWYYMFRCYLRTSSSWSFTPKFKKIY